jgi:hypothetical protein
MTTAAKQTMYQQITEHGNNLNAIFNTGIEPVKLCKSLRRLEAKAHQLATDYCNGENGVNTENWEIKTAPILAAVRKILYPNGMTGDGQKDWCIFLNGDCRGYALKIRSEYVSNNNIAIYKDWGGYGILAPDFTPSK